MKPHTLNFKNEIRKFGRQIDSNIVYTIDGTTTTLTARDINLVSYHYEGGILKSVMKQLDIDSNINIPLETIINCQFGVKINNTYEYLDLGNYVVYSSEKQEDTNSYKIVCYDKMLYSMRNYENVSYTYPMTIRDYLGQICNTLGLTFANSNDTFANYNKILTQDVFLEENGTFLGYTFRDVLDQIAGATASTICINENDELEIRYINPTNDTINEEYLKNIKVNFGEKYGPINSIVLSRSAESDNVYLRDEESVSLNGLCEIKIIDNQIMNRNDRADYIPDILNQLDGLEYYINDYSSTGVTYYDLCDRYNVSIGENTYSCIMFNDEINITQGLEENIFVEIPEESETDYTKADKTDRRINQAYIIVDKQRKEINSVVQAINTNVNNLSDLVDSQGNQIDSLGTRITQNVESITASVSAIESQIDNGVNLVKTTSVEINNEGINVSTDTSKIKTTMDNDSFEIKDNGDNTLAFFGYDEDEGISKAEMDNLTVTNYFIAGVHRVETIDVDGEERTGYFYIGG